jgi:hypothetical protein
LLLGKVRRRLLLLLLLQMWLAGESMLLLRLGWIIRLLCPWLPWLLWLLLLLSESRLPRRCSSRSGRRSRGLLRSSWRRLTICPLERFCDFFLR